MIKRKARTIPFGYKLSENTDYIEPIESELQALQEAKKLGIRSFILSGYPHLEECKHFGSKVLPNIKTCSLPHVYGRVPNNIPSTPLGLGERN